MAQNVRWRLCVMMFLQYAVWGTWFVALGGYMGKHLGFTGVQIGWLYSILPLATIVGPLTGGQIADRWLPTQEALGIYHLLGGAVLFVLAVQETFFGVMVGLTIACLLYAPTLALTNSLAFRNLQDPQRDFGFIRVGGSIGWIAANCALSWMREYWHTETPLFIDFFLLGGAISVLTGLYCFTLPHTPPAEKPSDPLAFREALVLLRNHNYLIFFLIAFVVATELELYFILTFPFLEGIGGAAGLTSANLPRWMTIAQGAEIFTMALLLPFLLPRWGVRKCMMLGMVAWPIRYFIFVLTFMFCQTAPWMVWVSVAALSLHGFCYVFFFVVAFIYTDMVAPKDIRASAQALINVAVLGIGLFVGAQFTGWLAAFFTDPATKAINYGYVFAVPAAITMICAVLFLVLFRAPEAAKEPQPSHP